MQNVPLYFRFQQRVFGSGFAADVDIRGRVTCTEEFGAVWIYGVNPGGIAGYGEDMKSGYVDFRTNVIGVLFDLANWANGFEDFREEVSKFLAETNKESVTEWEAARQAIRDGQAAGVELPQREERDLHPVVVVEKLGERLSPTLNRLQDPSEDQVPPAQLASAA